MGVIMYTIHKSVNLPMLEVGTYVFRASTRAPECTQELTSVFHHMSWAKVPWRMAPVSLVVVKN